MPCFWLQELSFSPSWDVKTVPSGGFLNILEGHLPFYSGKDGYNKIPQCLLQVNSVGRIIPYYSGFFLSSWDLPLPVPTPISPAIAVGMVIQ